MTTQTFDTQGIMFHRNDDSSFPTLAEVARTDYVNTYSLDIPDDILEWFAVSYCPRFLMYHDEDREAMDETNFDVIASALGDDIPDIYSAFSYRDGSAAWDTIGVDDARDARCAIVDNRVLIVSPKHEALDSLLECLLRLENYPLLDENAYSEREWNAWLEYAPTAFRDEILDAQRNPNEVFSEDILEALEANSDALLPILSQYLHSNDGFSGEYGPPFLDIFDGLCGENESPQDAIRRLISKG